MSGAHIHANEVQKTIEPVRQPGRELIRQQEQGPVQAVAPQVAYRRVQLNRDGLRPADLLALQRAVGNRTVQRMLAKANDEQQDETAEEDSERTVQTKLTVGAPKDVYEQEADRVAGQVMTMPDAATQRPNRTGLPDGLKSGKDVITVNDDDELEHETEVMGARADALGGRSPKAAVVSASRTGGDVAVQRVGEEKKDFTLKKTADSTTYDDGEKLFKEALQELRILRKQRKREIFSSIPEEKKKGKRVTDVYGGGLKNLKNMELLLQTPQFKGPAPHLLIKDDEVRYQAAQKPGEAEAPAPISIATFTARAFQPLAVRPGEAKRDVYTGGEPDKQYVKDVRNVPTRRYAYVEKNYWQFMEFLARNKLEGRYQNFFHAANPGVARPSVTGTRKSESNMVRRGDPTRPLTTEQLAMLHQWKGSGLQRRRVEPDLDATEGRDGREQR